MLVLRNGSWSADRPAASGRTRYTHARCRPANRYRGAQHPRPAGDDKADQRIRRLCRTDPLLSPGKPLHSPLDHRRRGADAARSRTTRRAPPKAREPPGAVVAALARRYLDALPSCLTMATQRVDGHRVVHPARLVPISGRVGRLSFVGLVQQFDERPCLIERMSGDGGDRNPRCP